MNLHAFIKLVLVLNLPETWAIRDSWSPYLSKTAQLWADVGILSTRQADGAKFGSGVCVDIPHCKQKKMCSLSGVLSLPTAAEAACVNVQSRLTPPDSQLCVLRLG